jgi:hypothetical protein
VHRGFGARPEGKCLFRSPRRRWEDRGYCKHGFSEDWLGECADWAYLAQDRDKLRAVINAVMKILIHEMRGIS